MYIYDANSLTERVLRCCFVGTLKYGGLEFVFFLSASKTTWAPIFKETPKPKLQFLIELRKIFFEIVGISDFGDITKKSKLGR